MRRPSERERACDGTRCDFCASRPQASRDDEGRCARGRVGSSLPRRARWFPRGLRPRRGPATTTARGGRLKARPPGRFDVDGDVNGMTTPHPDLGAFCTQNATQADGVTGSASVPVIKKKNITNWLVRLFLRLPRVAGAIWRTARPHRTARTTGPVSAVARSVPSASESTFRCFGAKARALRKARGAFPFGCCLFFSLRRRFSVPVLVERATSTPGLESRLVSSAPVRLGSFSCSAQLSPPHRCANHCAYGSDGLDLRPDLVASELATAAVTELLPGGKWPDANGRSRRPKAPGTTSH